MLLEDQLHLFLEDELLNELLLLRLDLGQGSVLGGQPGSGGSEIQPEMAEEREQLSPFPLSKMIFRTNYICYYNNLYSYHDTFLSPVQLTFLLNNERPQLLLLSFPLLRVRLQKVASSDCLSNFH